MCGGAAAAYVCPLPAAAVAPVRPVIAAAPVVFNPVNYAGTYEWFNLAVKDAWVERHRQAYQEIAERLPRVTLTIDTEPS